ncbi:MOXD2 protein, partial [Onychorhynchus coronatus]|nr:MOXD2 protein [Onychorhynchus coronatus]
LLFLLCFCPSQPSAPLLYFSTFLDPSNMVHHRWDHNDQELMTFEVQIHTIGWVAFGFSPHGELPGSDTMIGGVFPNGSIYFSVS